MLACAGVVFGPRTFAMYSASPSTLLIKNTVVFHLAVRQVLDEIELEDLTKKEK
jgi:hypothetical protein